MRKNSVDIEKWLNIIHNDLYVLHTDNISKMSQGDGSDIRNELRGFRDSLLLDSCSGVGYIFKDKYFTNAEDIEDVDYDADEDIEIDRVISVNYLLSFLNQILRK